MSPGSAVDCSSAHHTPPDNRTLSLRGNPHSLSEKTLQSRTYAICNGVERRSRYYKEHPLITLALITRKHTYLTNAHNAHTHGGDNNVQNMTTEREHNYTTTTINPTHEPG